MRLRKGIEERKREVYDHMATIIAQRGFSQVSTSTVASAMGISQPALYKYFSNRDEMILGFLEFVQGLLGMILEELKGLSGTRERLEVFYRRQLELVEQNSLLPRLLFFEEFHLAPGPKQEMLARIVAEFEAGIEKTISEGIDRGEIRAVNPRTAVAFIKGSVLVVYLNWSLGGKKAPLAEASGDLMMFLEQTLFC